MSSVHEFSSVENRELLLRFWGIRDMAHALKAFRGYFLFEKKIKGANLQISYLCSPPKVHSSRPPMNLGPSQAEGFQVEVTVTETGHWPCVKMSCPWFCLCDGLSELSEDLAA